MYEQKRQRVLDSDTYKITDAIDWFSCFPYRQSPFRRRNWGHRLHSVCSYPSKMKPSIAYALVTRFTKPKDVVCDPFSGSGTIPLEACLNGRYGIGYDINPLGHIITHAKTRPPRLADALRRIDQLEHYINDVTPTKKDIDQQTEEEIKKFYHQNTMREIIQAKQFFISTYNNGYTDVDYFLIASLAHILHGNRPYALSRRSHNIIPISPKGVVCIQTINKIFERKNCPDTKEQHSEWICRGRIVQLFCTEAFRQPISVLTQSSRLHHF